jgi:hypothetical protein
MKRSIISLAAVLFGGPLMAQDITTDWNDWLGTTITAPYDVPAHRSYDFWTGSWRAEWLSHEEGNFDFTVLGNVTRHYVFPALDGKVLIEMTDPFDLDPSAAQGRGFSIRYYIEEEDRWIMAQNWPGPANSGIAFTDQLTGSFTHGRVELFSVTGRPNEDGSDNHRRYIFSDITDQTFRWDGSQSSDRGQTWFMWNAVPFTRLAAFPDLVTQGPDLPTYGEGKLCIEAPHGNLDGLVGTWEGTVSAGGTSEPARAAAGRMLDGCAVGVTFHHPDSGFRLLTFYGFSDLFGHWVQLRIDNQPGTRHEYRITPEAEPRSFEQAPRLAIANRYDRYLSMANFNSEGAVTRTRFELLDDDHVVIVEEVRPTPDAEWELDRRYDLQRTS